MEIEGLRFPDELYYDEHHQWASLDGETVTMGITDYAQNSSGDIVFIELPRPGLTVRKGQPLGSIESGKWVGRLYAPVSGTVIEINDTVTRNPRGVNKDPYGAGWMVRLKHQDRTELDNLMHGESVKAFVEAELEKDRLTDNS
jgi:glycine cleavage system H protein